MLREQLVMTLDDLGVEGVPEAAPFRVRIGELGGELG